MVINSDLNGTLNSDFNTRKINVWNYIYRSGGVFGAFADFATFQDNTNNTSTRFKLISPGGRPIYDNLDKDFYGSIHDNHQIIEANFRSIIEYLE